MGRTRHHNVEVERVLAEAEDHGWTFEVTGNKFKGRCGCGKHTHSIDQGRKVANRTWKNLRTQLSSCPRW